MILPVVQLIAMQGMPTAVPLPSPTPTSVSERGVLSDGLDALAARTQQQTGGTLGVVIWDLGTGVNIQRNAELPFPMASVQKLPLAVLTYAAIDNGKLRPDEAIEVQPDDVIRHVSPIAEEYDRGKHTFSVHELLVRMLQDSDNTAADVLYRVLGGSQAINASLDALGLDSIVFRTDEAGLAADAKAGRTFARGGDNAGSPSSIASLLADLAQGRILTADSRNQLRAILSGVNTFPGRLRAGFPPETPLEHKTGTSDTMGGVTDATNDVGIATVNGRTIIVVAMLRGARGTDAERDAILASVARVAYDATRLFPTQ